MRESAHMSPLAAAVDWMLTMTAHAWPAVVVLAHNHQEVLAVRIGQWSELANQFVVL